MKELVVLKQNDLININLFEDGNLTEHYEENLLKPMLEENIYIGKVQNVLKGMQAAFVNIGKGKNVFIHLRDILPKNNNEITGKEVITDYIRPGKPLLVQIMKDANNMKGGRVTTHISLKGRYLIYMPNANYIAFSQKINEENKEKLKEIFLNKLPNNDGVVVRTAAQNASKEKIENEIDRLVEKWNKIQNINVNEIPEIVYDAKGILGKYIVDILDRDIDKIITNDNEILNKINDIQNEFDSNIPVEIQEEDSIYNKFNLEKESKKLDKRKIWLDCGGFIVIDKTEALTAIDVNSGKCIGKDSFENTILKINTEAAIEITKQMRLRDIGGIIIIDFIDMHIQENKDRIIEVFENEIKKDISKVQIEGFTKLNLLELTRKRVYSK